VRCHTFCANVMSTSGMTAAEKAEGQQEIKRLRRVQVEKDEQSAAVRDEISHVHIELHAKEKERQQAITNIASVKERLGLVPDAGSGPTARCARPDRGAVDSTAAAPAATASRRANGVDAIAEDEAAREQASGASNERKQPNVLIGVCGGLGAKCASELVPKLIDRLSAIATVKIVFTCDVERTAHELWQTMQQYPQVLWCGDEDDSLMEGLCGDLCAWADCLLVAPLSMKTLGILAAGIEVDLLSQIALLWPWGPQGPAKPFVVAPMLPESQRHHPVSIENLKMLDKRGVRIVKPVYDNLDEEGRCSSRDLEAQVDDLVNIFKVELVESLTRLGVDR